LLLFTAARHEIWKKARAELAKGTWVVAARNYFSTLAYQGYGEGLDLDLIINTTQRFTDETYMNPDFTVILSLEDEDEREKRITQRGKLKNPDTFESRGVDFQQKVAAGYQQIAQQRRLPIISALQSPKLVAEQIHQLVR